MSEEIKKVLTVDVSSAVKSLQSVKDNVDNTAQSFNSIKEYKQYIDKLTASMIDLDSTSDEYKKTADKVKEAQDKLNTVVKDAKKDNNAVEGSYNAIQKQLTELKKAWKETSDEAERSKLAPQINDVNEKLKELDASIGNYQRNVGNYESAFTSGLENISGSLGSLGAPLTAATSGFKQLSVALKALIANPIGAAITAIVLAVTALTKAFKSNEGAMASLKKSFSVFDPVINAVKKSINSVVDGIANLVSYIPKGVAAIVDFGGTMVKWLNKIGIVSDEKYAQIRKDIEETSSAIRNGTTEAQKAAEIEASLAEKRRTQSVNEAKYKRDIEALNAKIADEEKYNAEQRAKYSAEAEALAKRMLDEQTELAKLELQVANYRVESGDKSTEALDAQAEAQKNLFELEENYYSRLASLTSQRIQANKDLASDSIEVETEITKSTDENSKERERIKEQELKRISEIEDELSTYRLTSTEKTKVEIENKYKEDLALLQKYGLDTKALTEKYLSDIGDVDYNERIQLLQDLNDEYSFQSDIIDKTYTNEFEKTQRLLALDRERLESRKTILQEMLLSEEETSSRYKEIQKEIEKVDAELDENREKNNENDKRRTEDLINNISTGISALSNLMSTITDITEENIRKRYEQGEITEEQAKDEFETVKKAQIAAAIVNGLAGVATAIATAMQLGAIIGPIVGAINAATVIATTAAQVSKIKATTFDTSSTSGSTSSNVSTATPNMDAMSITPSYSNNINTNSDVENLQDAVYNGTKSGTQDMRVYVLESDINQVGTKVKVRDEEASF